MVCSTHAHQRHIKQTTASMHTAGMQRPPVLQSAPRSARPAFLSASQCAQRSSAKCSAAQHQQRDTPVAQRLQTAGAALALSAALVLGPVPCALADLNKYEAAAGGEFGNGTALQFGEVRACAKCSASLAAAACSSALPDVSPVLKARVCGCHRLTSRGATFLTRRGAQPLPSRPRVLPKANF